MRLRPGATMKSWSNFNLRNAHLLELWGKYHCGSLSLNLRLHKSGEQMKAELVRDLRRGDHSPAFNALSEDCPFIEFPSIGKTIAASI